jgi:AcrR family transcriptional regulator
MSKGFTSPEPAADAESSGRRGYHHGNLREALIGAARDLLAERGPEGFTLIDAARRAGVSPAAPYRHFRDKDALLAAVALEGFRTFGARQAGAMRGAADPVSAFRAMGLAYLAFAREEPGAYAAMFMAHPGGTSPMEGDPGQDASGFGALIQGLKRTVGDPPPPGLDLVKLACQVWALSHGVAMLAMRDQLQKGFGVDPQEILLEGVERLVAGAMARASRALPQPAS